MHFKHPPVASHLAQKPVLHGLLAPLLLVGTTGVVVVGVVCVATWWITSITVDRTKVKEAKI
jgi:hypothetical protein